MAEAPRRHDLVRADPEAWAAYLAGRPDLADMPLLAGWAVSGRPLIVRRYLTGEGRDSVPLGLPLPPSAGKSRIAIALPVADLTAMVAPDLADAATHAPPGWRATTDALLALGARHGIAPRPFGGLLWQVVTGLTYLTPTSDLDLLWPCSDGPPPGLLAGIAAAAERAPMRIDGEVLLNDGTGVHWRELHAAAPDGAVLAKGIDRVEMRPVSLLTGRGDAAA